MREWRFGIGRFVQKSFGTGKIVLGIVDGWTRRSIQRLQVVERDMHIDSVP